MNHYFNVELAKQYGIEEAIIIENLYFWIKKNVANEVNKNDGRYWTYNSAKAFAEIFPYMSARKISRVLASLYEKDAILKGNYNELSIDRTMWYSFTDELISVMDLQKYDVAKISDSYDLTKNDTHLPKMSNGKTENDEPIPYSKPYNNQHIKEEKDKSFSKKDDFPSLAAEPPAEYEKPKKKRKVTPKDDALFEECWKEYRRKGNKALAKPIWDKIPQEVRERIMPHIKAYVSVRERSYQQDFERYLKDKTYDTVVYQRNNVIYDPEMFTDNEYRPILGDSIFWNEKLGVHIFIGYIDDLHDGYTDENRPNGATLFQNGYTFVWDSTIKKWVKQ